MSSGSRDGYSFVPRWNEEEHLSGESNSSCLRGRRKRYLCGRPLLSTFDPEGDTFPYVRDSLTDIQMEAFDGPGAQVIVKTIRLSVGRQSTQEGVCLLCWISADSILCDEKMVKL